ncbi:endonuclease [Olleya sp. R77988]|uniref:endonuclease n=1 Tax=Olleya sp. R77988 TaxID=3093875 RepID=UPI0037CB80B9
MKQVYLLFTTLLLTTLAFAQIPANYYDSATGLSGYALKTELSNIITSGHNDQGYGGLWIGYQNTDRDLYYENDNTILDIYSEIPTGADSYNYTYSTDQCGNYSGEGSCYNREHLVPQSSFNEASPMKNDIHHVYPTDGYVNGGRGSFAFGTVASATNTYSNGSKKGSSAVSGYSGTVFEPIDEFKGDVARALLYFATRYESTVNGYTSFDMFNGTNDQVFQTWAIDLLLDWHNNIDPVDQRDIDRNTAAYNFQGNANPFISHPEYANAIWNPSPDTQAPTTPTSLAASNPTATTVDLSWTASTDDTAVTTYDIYVDGTFYVTTNSNATTYTVTGLTQLTTYTFTVLAKDAANNMSALSTSDSATTIAGSTGGGSSDLYFSEYMEGSSNNKALEIANFTGSDITDLSAYELRLSSNGNSAWTATYNFPGGASINNNDVYVIGNGSLAVCTGVVDNSNNTITGFNGNDAIGLFKNGVLIDILGTLGDNSNFAQNTTLVRNSNISGGNTTFDIAEWTSSASNTCTDLGQHTQAVLNVTSINKNEFKIYPNPVKGNLLTIENSQNSRFEIYNILGKKILNGTITPNNNKVSLSSLSKGVYILKLENKNGTVTKKLIKE